MFSSLKDWWDGVGQQKYSGAKPMEVSSSVKAGRRAWVVIPDGRCAYIDHYKDDGHFGVRPVDFLTGLHYPNTSKHWSEEQRLSVPEEFALRFSEMVPADPAEIPTMYRGG